MSAPVQGSPNIQRLGLKGIASGLMPLKRDGDGNLNIKPKMLPMVIDFSTVGVASADLTFGEQDGELEFVQAAFIDNSLNLNPLTLIILGTLQKLVVPATAQGVFPIYTNNPLSFVASTTAGNGTDGKPLKISIGWMNIPAPYTQWGPITVNVGAITVAATPLASNFTSKSANILGADLILIAANAGARRRVVQNPANAPESIWLNFGAAAAAGTGIELVPGDKFDTQGGPIDQQDWHVFAVTNPHPVVAYEGT